jgi:hypothetical protein
MAEVWEGRDDVLSRPIAVKMLLPHLAADPSLQERFRREAVTAARLVHPGIVAIFDAGVERLGAAGASSAVLVPDERFTPEQPSTAFIVMELVPGETLRDLMGRAGPLAPELAVGIALQVTDALAHAHAYGLVHRDVKPANVLLRDEGDDVVRIKVADFGIAKVAAKAGDLTANGTVLGTPKYISPEQVQGGEPDARADLYSLGVVLFEMLAGRPPFEGSSDMATAIAHVQQPAPSLDEARPGLPAGLGELVSSLLVKDPNYRLGSALALSARLGAMRKALGFTGNGPGSYLHVGSAGGRALIGSGDLSEAAKDGRGGRAVLAGGQGATDQRVGDHAPTGLAGGTEVLGGSTEVLGGAAEVRGGATEVLPGGAGAGARASEAGAGRTGVLTGGAGVPSGGTGVLAGGTGVPAGDGTAVLVGRPSRQRPPRRGVPGPIGRKRARSTAVFVGSLLLAGCFVTLALVDSAHPSNPRSTQGGGRPTGTTTERLVAGGKALPIVAIQELAEGWNRPNDNLAALRNVIGTNPHADWVGARYQGSEFGRSGGFGLALQLAGAHVVHDLVVTSPMQGWTAEAFVGDSFSTTLAGWGTATSRHPLIKGGATFSLGDKSARWVLLWMIDPGPTRQAVIDKLVVR